MSFPELQHDNNSDDETETPAYGNSTINNNKDFVFTKPRLLNPSIDYDFSCTDFPVDGLSDSDTTITCNEIGDEVPEEPLPPEPPPECMPEITFASTSLILQ